MKVGIKYCGGCNPNIDRINLTKRLREKLKPDTYAFEYCDFHDCEVVLVINGCSVGCAEIINRARTPLLFAVQKWTANNIRKKCCLEK